MPDADHRTEAGRSEAGRSEAGRSEAGRSEAGRSTPLTPEGVERLTVRQQAEILRLVANASRTDTVAPLSEQVLLSVEDGNPESGRDLSDDGTRSLHLLAYDGEHLTGYAHLDLGAGGVHEVGDGAATAELVVDPPSRRKGVGTALVRALEDAVTPRLGQSRQRPALRLWSHGDLDAARTLALRGGYSKVRELWQMRRSLRTDAAALPPVSLREGFRARHFVVGRDEEAWLRVNALAFVDHPEQGRITRHDLDQRVAQDWFDPSGFILVEDVRGPAPVLAASHWTKVVGVVPADDPRTGRHLAGPAKTEVGEVYVVGVDPAYQGQGLGRTITVLGLEHLRETGLTGAMLYVDADNTAAVATYSRLDFVRSAVDIMYERIVHPPM
jgi:mycothiol synthase